MVNGYLGFRQSGVGEFAEQVCDGDVGLLNSARSGARHNDRHVADRRQFLAVRPSQRDRKTAARPRSLDCGDHVRRFAAGADRDKDVAAGREALNLTLEDLLEPIVVPNGRERRRVSGQRDRRIWAPLAFESAGEFRGDVLGVGGTAAVAAEQ